MKRGGGEGPESPHFIDGNFLSLCSRFYRFLQCYAGIVCLFQVFVD